MLVYFNSNGTLVKNLDIGYHAYKGSTTFTIFAYFNGVNVESEYTQALLYLTKPDGTAVSSNTPLLVNASNETITFLGIPEETYSPFVSGNIYKGFKFVLGDDDTILLDQAGTWTANISLQKTGSATLTGTFTFNVLNTALDLDDNVANIILSTQTTNALAGKMNISSDFFVRQLSALPTNNNFSSSLYNVGDLVYVKNSTTSLAGKYYLVTALDTDDSAQEVTPRAGTGINVSSTNVFSIDDTVVAKVANFDASTTAPTTPVPSTVAGFIKMNGTWWKLGSSAWTMTATSGSEAISDGTNTINPVTRDTAQDVTADKTFIGSKIKFKKTGAESSDPVLGEIDANVSNNYLDINALNGINLNKNGSTLFSVGVGSDNYIYSYADIVPIFSDSYNLGKTSFHFNNAYIKNLIYGNTTLPVTNIENTSNKVTSVDANSTDTQYASAKCLYTNIQDLKEIASGKCVSYSIDNTLTGPTEQTFASGTYKTWEGTALNTWADFIAYLGYTPVAADCINNHFTDATSASVLLVNSGTGNGYLICESGPYRIARINKNGNLQDAKIGDDILTQQTNVPDRWIYSWNYAYVLETVKAPIQTISVNGNSITPVNSNVNITVPVVSFTSGSETVSVGSNVLNVATRDTQQTITGLKTFTNGISMYGGLGLYSTSYSGEIEMNSDGDIEITTENNKAVRPATGVNTDLGTSTYKWNKYYGSIATETPTSSGGTISEIGLKFVKCDSQAIYDGIPSASIDDNTLYIVK